MNNNEIVKNIIAWTMGLDFEKYLIQNNSEKLGKPVEEQFDMFIQEHQMNIITKQEEGGMYL